MLEWLSGKKTYITAAIGALAFAARELEIIDQSTFNWIIGFDLPAALMSLRAGIKKVEL